MGTGDQYTPNKMQPRRGKVVCNKIWVLSCSLVVSLVKGSSRGATAARPSISTTRSTTTRSCLLSIHQRGKDQETNTVERLDVNGRLVRGRIHMSRRQSPRRELRVSRTSQENKPHCTSSDSQLPKGPGTADEGLETRCSGFAPPRLWATPEPVRNLFGMFQPV